MNICLWLPSNLQSSDSQDLPRHFYLNPLDLQPPDAGIAPEVNLAELLRHFHAFEHETRAAPFYHLAKLGKSGLSARIYNLTGVNASKQVRVHSTLYSVKLKRELARAQFLGWLLGKVPRAYFLEKVQHEFQRLHTGQSQGKDYLKSGKYVNIIRFRTKSF